MIHKTIVFLAAALFFASCDKQEQEPDCKCQKITKIAYDIFNIEEVPCQPESEGIDDNRYSFYIVCSENNNAQPIP